jgi:predicted nucleic acid-binding protein
VDAVLDTSILVRGLTTGPSTAVGFLMDSWSRRLFRVVLSQHILDELEHALAQSFFERRTPPERMTQYLTRVAQDSVMVQITAEVHDGAPSPADDLVLATAVTAGVPYVVTGDYRFRGVGSHQGVTIVDPGPFAGILRALLRQDPADRAE